MAKTLDEAIAFFRSGKSVRECEKLTGINYKKIEREAKKLGVVKGDGNDSVISSRVPVWAKPSLSECNPIILYIITAKEFNGAYKIGITNNISNRLTTLQTASPFKLFALRIYEIKNPRQVEFSLHLLFKNKRLQGEWFNLSEVDIDYIHGMLKDG
jgi:hypothetical protein